MKHFPATISRRNFNRLFLGNFRLTAGIRFRRPPLFLLSFTFFSQETQTFFTFFLYPVSRSKAASDVDLAKIDAELAVLAAELAAIEKLKRHH